MGFQAFVNNQPAPGVAGDFAAMNPEATLLSVPGGLVADSLNPPIVGNMAFANPNNGNVSSIFTRWNSVGFVHRDNQALIQPLVDQPGTLVLKPGLAVTLFDAGSFWGKFASINGAVAGEAVYADVNSGALFSADITQYGPLAAVTGNDVTATAGTNILNVGSVASGTIKEGQLIFPQNFPDQLPLNMKIVKQLTGTPGGAGTYTLNMNVAANLPAGIVYVLISYILSPFFVDRTVQSGEVAQISSWG